MQSGCGRQLQTFATGGTIITTVRCRRRSFFFDPVEDDTISTQSGRQDFLNSGRKLAEGLSWFIFLFLQKLVVL